MKVDINHAELNTILAALRLYQSMAVLPHYIERIAEPDGGPLCLDDQEIDDLCIRLNTEDGE